MLVQYTHCYPSASQVHFWAGVATQCAYQCWWHSSHNNRKQDWIILHPCQLLCDSRLRSHAQSEIEGSQGWRDRSVRNSGHSEPWPNTGEAPLPLLLVMIKLSSFGDNISLTFECSLIIDTLRCDPSPLPTGLRHPTMAHQTCVLPWFTPAICGLRGSSQPQLNFFSHHPYDLHLICLSVWLTSLLCTSRKFCQ